MRGQFLYRVQIVEYPDGALITDENDPRCGQPDPDWSPEDWAPDDYWIGAQGRGSDEFFWPSTYREWRSRSSAVKRKELIERYGAKAIIQRSARIVWPEDGQEHVR